MIINKLYADLKFNSLYTCAKCGKQEAGDTMRAEFKGHSTSELKDFIDSTYQSSRDMPVGWHFHDEFNCGCSK